jgi:DNA-binding PadR family transcriptional regulator
VLPPQVIIGQCVPNEVELCRVRWVTASRRPSPQTITVLAALAAEPGSWRYGYELVTGLAMNSGSLYPILMRLSERGLLDATWETDARPGRPARHMYRLTATGIDYASAWVTAPATAPPRLRPQGA